MKINIASSHRFHLLDLARELSRQGHDVAFYSYVPKKRCMAYGLDSSCIRSFTWLALPFFGLQKLLGSKSWIVKYRNLVMDYYVGHFMRPCDVYIALGTVYKDSFVQAKKRFGATTIMEWGSKHIDEQQRILREIGAPLNDEYFNKRTRESYHMVDHIAIASQHVLKSFMDRGFKRELFLVNPYGVDLSMFKKLPTTNRPYDVIMVGNWSLQKGCDLIVEAIKHSDLKFLHVGSLCDLPFPENDPRFTHDGPVDQKQLINFYNKAKVFVLPSRQDGFGMVLSQAVACNLPIVGSKDCGAPDLKDMVENPECVTVVQEHTWQAVLEGIKQALANYEMLKGKTYAGDAVENLTWKAYGKRYDAFIETLSKSQVIKGGVNLIEQITEQPFDVIMVGGWSMRKGCDLIVEAIKQTNWSFLHVGSLVDMPFPEHPQFTHFDSVNQDLLMFFYNMAKVFVLPSREEGLAMVQAQALACGLPVVCSPHSGGRDLRQFLSHPERVIEINEYTPVSLIDSIKQAMNLPPILESEDDASLCESMSWKAYGERYKLK